MAEKKEKAAPKAAAKKAEPAKKPAETKAAAPKAPKAPKVAKVAKPGAPKGTPTPAAVHPRGRHRALVGFVRSDKMDKTVVVEVEDRVKHALYGKVMRRNTRLKAHDEANDCGVGDRVLIMETRPLSATKRWRVVEILEKAAEV